MVEFGGVLEDFFVSVGRGYAEDHLVAFWDVLFFYDGVFHRSTGDYLHRAVSAQRFFHELLTDVGLGTDFGIQGGGLG